jgi:phenylacetic acid degradation operon negative regulatory protein
MSLKPELPRPRSLILYIYGGFVRRLGGWLAVADLIRLMDDLGVDDPAVRSAVARMKRVGLLAKSSRAGVPGYELAPEAWSLLDEGDRRILTTRQRADLSEGWVLVIFSVPETERDRRHQIRRRLTWLGFGTVAPGVWIAPWRLRPEVEAALAALNVDQYAEVFEIRYGGLDASRKLVRRCWDLDRLDQMYASFTDHFEPILDRWTRGPAPPGEQAFIDYIGAISEWRTLPFLDPGLPMEVLPNGWAGERATWIYFSLLGRIDSAAFAYVKSIAG